MIFYHKKDREYFNYDTNTNKYYYLHKGSVGRVRWGWDTNEKNGTIVRLAPNTVGVWQDDK